MDAVADRGGCAHLGDDDVASWGSCQELVSLSPSGQRCAGKDEPTCPPATAAVIVEPMETVNSCPGLTCAGSTGEFDGQIGCPVVEGPRSRAGDVASA